MVDSSRTAPVEMIRSPRPDLRLEGAAGADPDEGRTLRDRQDLRHRDLDVVRADPGRDDRDTEAAIRSGDRRELPVAPLELDASRRVAIRAVRSGSPGRRMYSASSPGPSPMWYCRSPIGEGYAGIVRVRQDLVPHSGVLRWRETRARIVPASRERQAAASAQHRAWPTLSRPSGRPGVIRRCHRPTAQAGRWWPSATLTGVIPGVTAGEWARSGPRAPTGRDAARSAERRRAAARRDREPGAERRTASDPDLRETGSAGRGRRGVPGRRPGRRVRRGPAPGPATADARHRPGTGSPTRTMPDVDDDPARSPCRRRSTRPIALRASSGRGAGTAVGLAAEDDPADRRAVVEAEPVRLEPGHEPADPDGLADVLVDRDEIDVRGHAAGPGAAPVPAPAPRPRRGPAAPRRAAGRAVGRLPARRRHVARRTRERSRSVGPSRTGYGRRTMPTIVAVRPSTIEVTGIAGPGEARGRDALAADEELRLPAIAELVEVDDVAATRTSRHSCAAPGAPRSVEQRRRALPCRVA